MHHQYLIKPQTHSQFADYAGSASTASKMKWKAPRMKLDKQLHSAEDAPYGWEFANATFNKELAKLDASIQQSTDPLGFPSLFF